MISHKQALIVLAGILLVAGWGRWISASHVFDLRFNPDKSLYFDEYVYIALGQNLMDRGDYSMRKQYPQMLKAYSKVPKYVNDPLFKHPPLVPLAVGVSMKAFENNIRAAFLPGLLAGVAMIGLAYWLSLRLLRNEIAALFAALLLAISPTQWICSSRILLEAPLACFILAAMSFQLAAPRRYAPWAAAGWALAWWTKYTALPMWALCQFFLLAARPSLLRSRRYWIWQAILGALYLPWLIWRLNHDGASLFLFWQNQTEEWRALARLLERPSTWVGLTAAICCVGGLLAGRRQNVAAAVQSRWAASHGLLLAWGATALALVVLALLPEIASFHHLPWTGGTENKLKNEPAWTYLARQFWFEPVTFLGMTVGLLIPGRPSLQTLKVVAAAAAILMTAWGNFQMRYFLPAVPLLEILTAGALLFLFRKLKRDWAIWILLPWLGWSATRSLWLIWKIAIPNDAFYF